MEKELEFFESWTSILFTEATLKPGGCLEVPNIKQNKHGYPEFRLTIPGIGQKHLLAARLMFMCHHKQLKVIDDVSHLCHNRLCININHLVNESRTINLNRQVCRNTGVCTQLHAPPCLFP